MEQAMCVAGLKQRTYATIFKAKMSNSRTATQQMCVCASFSLSYVAYSKCVYRYCGARTTLNWLLLLYWMPFCAHRAFFLSLFISACVLLAPFLFFLFFTIFFLRIFLFYFFFLGKFALMLGYNFVTDFMYGWECLRVHRLFRFIFSYEITKKKRDRIHKPKATEKKSKMHK